jgi:hypothetical protein
MRVSHETIYRTLYVQTRGALKKELKAHLRRSTGIRRNIHAKRTGHGMGQIADAVSISVRPPEAADRAVPGHWEGDLLAGNKHSNIATLVERQSRFVMLVRLQKRDTGTVVKAVARRIKRLPLSLKQSLTWDRGKEMAQHKSFTIATDVQVCFCDPSSPWQRGSNENTNGLLRQYFPKGTDLSNVTQRQLDQIALKLNTRPRETLGWQSPAEVMAATVASNRLRPPVKESGKTPQSGWFSVVTPIKESLDSKQRRLGKEGWMWFSASSASFLSVLIFTRPFPLFPLFPPFPLFPLFPPFPPFPQSLCLSKPKQSLDSRVRKEIFAAQFARRDRSTKTRPILE